MNILAKKNNAEMLRMLLFKWAILLYQVIKQLKHVLKLLNLIFLAATVTWFLPKQNDQKSSMDRNAIKITNFCYSIS